MSLNPHHLQLSSQSQSFVTIQRMNIVNNDLSVPGEYYIANPGWECDYRTIRYVQQPHLGFTKNSIKPYCAVTLYLYRKMLYLTTRWTCWFLFDDQEIIFLTVLIECCHDCGFNSSSAVCTAWLMKAHAYNSFCWAWSALSGSLFYQVSISLLKLLTQKQSSIPNYVDIFMACLSVEIANFWKRRHWNKTTLDLTQCSVLQSIRSSLNIFGNIFYFALGLGKIPMTAQQLMLRH